MKKFYFLGILFSIFYFLFSFSVSAQDKTELIYFLGDGCPHCAKESKFLENISEKYPKLKITKYEVWYNAENQKLFAETAKGLGITRLGVPLTIIGDKYFIGYQDDETTGKEIEEQIASILGAKPAFAKATAGEKKNPFFWRSV